MRSVVVLEKPELAEGIYKWYEKTMKHIYPKGYLVVENFGYVCKQVGIPTLIGGFSIILGIAYLLISLIIPCCKCGQIQSEGSDMQDPDAVEN